MRHLLALSAQLTSDLVLGIALLWLAGLYIYQPLSLLPAALLAGVALWYRHRRGTFGRGRKNRLWLWGLVLLGILTYKLLPAPSPDAWQTPWARAPHFDLRGDTLTISNLRDFRYRSETDYDVRYRTESYKLSDITGADFGECHWDGMEAICHTMISFTFADGRHLVVSAETRLPVGEEQNSIGGLYKRYGLLYIFGTEEDIFALRTNHRHEDLILLPLRIQPKQARAMLLHFVALAEQAEREHQSYNTLTSNCSSGVMKVFRSLAPHMPRLYNLAPIHNGSISRLLYRHGALITQPGESYDTLRKRCYLGYDLSPASPENYSTAIRTRRDTPSPTEAPRDNPTETSSKPPGNHPDEGTLKGSLIATPAE